MSQGHRSHRVQSSLEKLHDLAQTSRLIQRKAVEALVDEESTGHDSVDTFLELLDNCQQHC